MAVVDVYGSHEHSFKFSRLRSLKFDSKYIVFLIISKPLMMNQEQSVDKNGHASVKEELTLNKVLVQIDRAIYKYPNRRFFYQVMIQRKGRDEHQQKTSAMDLVEDQISNLLCHDPKPDSKFKVKYQRKLNCRTKECKWKAIIIIIAQIKEVLIKEEDRSATHSGWLIFTGYCGSHLETVLTDFNIMPGFSEIDGLDENHSHE